MRKFSHLLMLLNVLQTWCPAWGQTLSPNQPYRAERSHAVTYDIDFRVAFTPPYKCKLLKVWLPIPQSDFGQEVHSSELSTFPLHIKPIVSTEKVFGNKFAYFEFEHAEGAQIVRHQLKITTWQLNWKLDSRNLAKITEWPEAFRPYLKSEQQAVVVDERVKELGRQFATRPSFQSAELSSVFDWAIKNLKYDHEHASLSASALHAFDTRRGHCSDFHGLCASLGRSVGYPTRVVYGINAFAKNSPSHCKLEAFLPPYGWVSFDVSETQKLMNGIKANDRLPTKSQKRLRSAARARLLSGFRDNTWYCQTKGTDYDLAPPAIGRVPVVRTIYAEADGAPLPEPDPANPTRREYSWMTAHEYRPSHPVKYPFDDIETLRDYEVDDANQRIH